MVADRICRRRRRSGDVLADFVDYYNGTYAGLGGRAKSIPACWYEHPGLVAEVAVLAYAWRATNLGSGVNIRDAGHWLHQ